MRSTFLFKISASLLKPTRETILDYCSYCLVVISLIGVARVWIGGESLKIGCPLIDEALILTATRPTKYHSPDEPNSGDGALAKTSTESIILNKLLESTYINSSIPYQNSTNAKSILAPNTTSYYSLESDKCAKYYQAVFAYILLIESSILLFSGLIWTQVPKIASTLKKFTKLIHKCEESDWARKALNVITNKQQTYDVSQSLYSVMSSDCTSFDIRSLLDTLFHPDGEYKAKAKARHLYEKVQTFCHSQSEETNVWRTYLFKSIVQFGIWFITFNINLVLFVVLEFYVICPEDSNIPCEHDTFLRIVWFMGQSILLIYAVFNCKTLRWINEKSIVRRRPCHNSFNCFRTSRTFYTDDDTTMLTCKPFRFANNAPVCNDVALLLYLLEEAHPKILPYFVVFMFPEWKEKLTSFANPVHMSDRPIGSAMQMLSGRPPPIIEIIDIPNVPEVQETVARKKDINAVKKDSNSVTFYIGPETETTRQSTPKSSPAKKNDASSNNNVLLPIPKSPKRKHKNKDDNIDLIKFSSKALDSVSYTKPSPVSKLLDPVFCEEGVTDEATALVHRTSSSEDVENNVSNDPSVYDTDPSSDGSERNLLRK